MIKYSIILTTYNSEQSIIQTIDSILNQEGVNADYLLELIVVDDCSTDNTKHLLKEKGIEFSSTEKNSGGPNKGRNIGIAQATGDFICIADHDDVWNKNKLKALLPFLDKAPIITSGYTITDLSQGGKIIERINHSDKGFILYPKNETFIQKISKGHQGQNTYLGSIVYSKELKNMLFEEHFGMIDFDWIARIFHQNESLEVSQALYSRVIESTNLSLNENYRAKDFEYSLKFIEEYRSVYPAIIANAYKRIHGSRARYYYLLGNMKQARFYFLKAELSLTNILYYLTTFVGSSFIKKKFNVFG